MAKQVGGSFMKLFSTEGPFYKFMMQFMDLLTINILWILCSMPIITIGASTAAACSVTMKMAKDEEGYIARQFFKAFKQNWKQGTILGFLMALVAYAFYLDTQILKAASDPSYLVIVMTFGLAIVYVLCFTYAFALIARYENTIKNTIQNSIKITFRYFGRTLAMLFSLALIYIVLSFNAIMLFFLILIGPGCLFYTYGFFCRGIFEKIEKDQESGL